jgi:hypothetical protein
MGMARTDSDPVCHTWNRHVLRDVLPRYVIPSVNTVVADLRSQRDTMSRSLSLHPSAAHRKMRSELTSCRISPLADHERQEGGGYRGHGQVPW